MPINQPSSARQRPERRLSVLIADDDKSMRDYLCAVLEWSGCSVSDVEDGLQVLDQVFAAHEGRARVPDVIVADVVMPGLCGLEVVEAATSLLERVPVILVTAKPLAEIEGEAARVGAAALVGKPVDPWALCRLVEDLARLRFQASVRAAPDYGGGET